MFRDTLRILLGHSKTSNLVWPSLMKPKCKTLENNNRHFSKATFWAIPTNFQKRLHFYPIIRMNASGFGWYLPVLAPWRASRVRAPRPWTWHSSVRPSGPCCWLPCWWPWRHCWGSCHCRCTCCCYSAGWTAVMPAAVRTYWGERRGRESWSRWVSSNILLWEQKGSIRSTKESTVL